MAPEVLGTHVPLYVFSFCHKIVTCVVPLRARRLQANFVFEFLDLRKNTARRSGRGTSSDPRSLL